MVRSVGILAVFAWIVISSFAHAQAPANAASGDAKNDLQRIMTSCSSGMYGEAVDRVIALVKDYPQLGAIPDPDKKLLLDQANNAVGQIVSDLAKQTGGVTTEQQVASVGAEIKTRMAQLSGAELRSLEQMQSSFRRAQYVDSLARTQSNLYFADLAFIRGSSETEQAKSAKAQAMVADLTGAQSALETEKGVKAPLTFASILRTQAALTAYVDPANNAFARDLLRKAKNLADGTPELVAQIDRVDGEIQANTLRMVPVALTPAPTPAIQTTTPRNAREAGQMANQFMADYIMPLLAFIQTNLTMLLVATGVILIFWVIPNFIINRQTSSGDIAASMYKVWVVRLGLIGYIVYLLRRPRPEKAPKSEAAPKVKKKAVAKTGSRTSSISCPVCRKPIDLIEDYFNQKFDECPHCHGAIEPLYEPENYLQYLIDQLVAAAGSKRKKKQTEEGSQAMSNLLRGMYNLAVHRRATDIHIERDEQGAQVRFRVDGMLVDAMKMPPAVAVGFLSAIKVQSNLDITNHMTPQDGRCQMEADGANLDVRINCSPSHQGEILFMRLLDKKRITIKPKDLGFEGNYLKTFEDAIHKPHGLILVTGPTGSGKSTTLYVALNQINTGERNILTIEDPVEYQLDGLKQMQVNPDKNFTFATGLRSILRQDPDVIMVGEIRDSETAAMAIDAAVTGHLVFSTLHTMDTSSAISRLNDLGVTAKRYATALEVILAQRLVRVICSECKQPHMPEDAVLERLGILRYKNTIKFMAGPGCQTCNFTGYYGRRAILEMLRPDEELREMMEKESSPQILRDAARRKGMKLLREDGIMKVVAGQTTVEEVLRATDEVRKRAAGTGTSAGLATA